MSRSPCLVLFLLAAMGAWGLVPGTAQGQMLRFDNYRDLVMPDNANIRLGNFYSDWAFSQSVGARYSETSGDEVLYRGPTRLGRWIKDGADFPMVSSLSLQNYLLINQYMDIDLSVNLSYSYYPVGTEDDQLDVNIASEGASARMGAFSMSVTRDSLAGGFNGRNVTANTYTRRDGDKGADVSATLSTEFDLTKYIRARLYDTPSYTADYVDRRGRRDDLRGEKYTYFQNTLGLDLDWLMAKNQELAYSFRRVDTWPQDNDLNQARSTETRQSLLYQNQLNPVLLVGARADFIWREFDESLRGDQFQHEYLGFMGADLSENTTLSLGAGYSTAELEDPGPFEQEGTSDSTIGFISLRSMLTARTAHGIGYSRRQEGGFEAGLEIVDQYRYALEWRNDLWSWSFLSLYETVEPRLSSASEYSDWLNQVGVSRTLTRHMTGVANVAHTVRDNSAIAPDDLNADQIYIYEDYTTWAVNLGLTQRLTDRLGAYYYVEHLEQSGASSSLDYERDTIGATLTYHYDF
jgi:hypothetical protein